MKMFHESLGDRGRGSKTSSYFSGAIRFYKIFRAVFIRVYANELSDKYKNVFTLKASLVDCYQMV